MKTVRGKKSHKRKQKIHKTYKKRRKVHGKTHKKLRKRNTRRQKGGQLSIITTPIKALATGAGEQLFELPILKNLGLTSKLIYENLTKLKERVKKSSCYATDSEAKDLVRGVEFFLKNSDKKNVSLYDFQQMLADDIWRDFEIDREHAKEVQVEKDKHVEVLETESKVVISPPSKSHAKPPETIKPIQGPPSSLRRRVGQQRFPPVDYKQLSTEGKGGQGKDYGQVYSEEDSETEERKSPKSKTSGVRKFIMKSSFVSWYTNKLESYMSEASILTQLLTGYLIECRLEKIEKSKED